MLRAKTRKKLSKANILATSARVFKQRGFFGTTLDDIARALGVTKAALYHYVKTKEDLLFECHQNAMDIAMKGIHEALDDNLAPDEQLAIVLKHYVQSVIGQPKGAVLFFEERALSPRRRKQIIARRDEYEGKLRQIIENGISKGTFVECDAKLIGFAIFGAINWMNKWYSQSGERTVGFIAETFGSYLVRGLLKRHVGDIIPDRSERPDSGRIRIDMTRPETSKTVASLPEGRKASRVR